MKTGKPNNANKVEKEHEKYTRERGGLPPCPSPNNLLKCKIQNDRTNP
jgi:hypothetical protein